MIKESGSAAIAIEAAGCTDIGRSRDHNEDSLLVRKDLNLYIVADGAGGHNAGEIASRLVVKSMENFFEATEIVAKKQPEADQFGLMTQARRLAAAVQKANADVVEIARTSEKRKGMGSTVVAAYLRPAWKCFYLAHVGDSRCYRLRSGQLEVLTHDHTMKNDILELRPDVDDKVLSRLPCSVVTRAIGLGERVRVELRSHRLVPGDRYLLCSDGLYGDISEAALYGALSSPEKPEQVCRQLIELVNRLAGGDNISALIIDYDRHGEHEPKKRPIPGENDKALVSSPQRGSLASAPEILLIGIESAADIDPDAEVKVLPTETDDASLREAVEDFVGPLRPDRTETPPDLTKPSQCGACREQIPIGARFCPYCGAIRKA